MINTDKRLSKLQDDTAETIDSFYNSPSMVEQVARKDYLTRWESHINQLQRMVSWDETDNGMDYVEYHEIKLRLIKAAIANYS